MKPYIGITGVVTFFDVGTIAECVALVPPTHRLMAGVLVSAKTLRGEAAESRRYPSAAKVETLLAECADRVAWPVVHYNTRATHGVLALELALLARLFPSMRGLQLNVVTPDPVTVAQFANTHRDVEVIVQINRGAFGYTPVPADAMHFAQEHSGGARHALLDLSGGNGRAVDVSFAARIVRGWGVFGMPPRLGVAGGLGPDAGGLLAALRDEAGAEAFAALSFDAESGVRVPVADPTPGAKHQDRLDRDRALAWVKLAALLGGGRA